MIEPVPPPPTPPPPEMEVTSQTGMRRLETYGAYEPTVLKARPRPAPEREEEISAADAIPRGSYVFVAVVAVGVAALLLLGLDEVADERHGAASFGNFAGALTSVSGRARRREHRGSERRWDRARA